MIRLLQTCSACPEQYDAYDEDGQKIGYLRLRHGNFTVECPDCGDELVYHAHPDGDGCFDPEERDYYLRFAVAAIELWTHGRVTRPPAPDVQYEVITDKLPGITPSNSDGF